MIYPAFHFYYESIVNMTWQIILITDQYYLLDKHSPVNSQSLAKFRFNRSLHSQKTKFIMMRSCGKSTFHSQISGLILPLLIQESPTTANTLMKDCNLILISLSSIQASATMANAWIENHNPTFIFLSSLYYSSSFLCYSYIQINWYTGIRKVFFNFLLAADRMPFTRLFYF